MMIRSRDGHTCLRSALAASVGRNPTSSASFHASSRPSSQRAGQLHSAAQVSSADADLSAPAAPQSPLTWATPRPPANDAEKALLAEQSLQTAKERRLSPVGLASLWHVGGPATLPANLREAMAELVSEGDSKLLRSDVKLTLANDAEGPDMKKRSQRSRAALLHLATASPQRYATIHQVLRTTAQRLARPLPSAAGEGEASVSQGWTPKRIVESGCAVGEGAWAAAEVWPELEQWSGNDSRPHLLATAEDILTLDSSVSEPSLLSRLRKAQPSSVEFEANKSHGVRYQRPASERKLDLNASEETTLNLSAYQLLSLSSDSAREQHVRSLWNSGAEAIVLIEEGTDRGFAAIASARALLLELGEEAKVDDVAPSVTSTEDDDGEVRERLVLGGVEFIEEKASDRVSSQEPPSAEDSMGRGCYVVAPCPHDRPCPLLHPFLLNLDHDTVTDVAKRSGPSHHHRASGVGLNSCLHPVRYLPPSWSRDLGSEERRRKREKGGREERSARMAYVVVKRGERPTMESLRQEADGEAVQRVEAAVPYARRGPIEELRKGDSLPRRLPEDVVDVEGENGEVDLQGDLSPSGELFKLLPQDLQQALSASQGGGLQEVEEQQLSQDQDLLERAAAAALQGHKTNSDGADVWAASAEAADSANAEQAEVEEAEATTEAEHNEDWLSTLLAANESRPEDQSGGGAGGEPEPSASDVASAVSLLVPSLPRIVMPPIKKGGHVTFDACHCNGSIQRYTISKAAGKQTYHEVRKSSWADLWSQDPVELAGPSRRVQVGEAAEAMKEEEENEDDDDDLGLLETRDEATGRRKWIKRRGWGQWSRVAPADPAAGMAMDGTGTPFKSSSSSSSPRSTRASDRPSAYIGADQICPLTSSGEVKGSKKKSSALSAATTSAAAGQRGARSRKGAKAYAGPRDKESKRKRSMNSYHEEVAEGFDSLSI